MPTVDVSNVGGIDQLSIEFEPGATLIAGPNASNKTSLLRAVAFALGAREVPIRSGADEARVRLEVGDRTVERRARRGEDGIEIEGEAWIDDPEDAVLVERFATLLETNPLRAEVAADGDIEELLKGPMNVDALEAERSRLLERKRELSDELDRLDDVDQRLADRRRELESQREGIARKEERLAELYDRREDSEDVDGELTELREERADLVSERERQSDQVAELEAAVDRIESRLVEVDERLAEARETAAAHDVEQLKRRRSRIESELEAVTERIDVLGSVLTANREMRESAVEGSLGREAGLLGDELTCWACGRPAEESDFEATIDRLEELIEADKQRRAEREPELEKLEERIEAARDAERRVRELEADRRELETRLENRRESLERKREALAETRERIAALDERIADRERERGESRSAVADEIESTRVAIETARRDIEQLEAACEELRKQQRRRDRLQAELGEVTDEIQALTDRIEGIEAHLREAFNAAMDDLLAALSFDRIDRVWLDGDFELVIAREAGGEVREESPAHLAESEREMIGLVLGLAGFLAHDAGDAVPALLVDSLGAFDADRAGRLLSYFSERTELLLAAVHPEMADRLDAETIPFGERPTP